MNFTPQSGTGDPRSTNPDPRIDAALRSIGSAHPTPGLEGRILNRLAAERLSESPARLPFLGRLVHYSLPALGFAAAGLVCTVVVIGSVDHSRRIQADHTPAPPVLVLPGNGLGAASAVHPAAPPSAPLPAGTDRGRSIRIVSRARAHIAPHAHKAKGVTVVAPVVAVHK